MKPIALIPRKGTSKPKKTRWPGTLTITGGMPRLLAQVGKQHPNPGNARRGKMLLVRVWQDHFRGAPVEKRELIAVAARSLRMAPGTSTVTGKSASGAARARRELSKCCQEMLEDRQFVKAS